MAHLHWKLYWKPLKSCTLLSSSSIFSHFRVLGMQTSTKMDYQKWLIIVILLSLSVGINGDNFTQNSTFQANLKDLLSSLSSNPSSHGFYNASRGRNADRVNGMVLCRGDVPVDRCHACVNTSATKIVELFPNQKEAVVWYDDCMLRYSNNSIAGTVTSEPTFYMSTAENVTNPRQFGQDLTRFLTSLRVNASSAERKFATGNSTVGNTTGNGSQIIYALAQCTPDLSAENCSSCLDNAVQYIPTCFSGKKAGRVIGPSCNFRYENYKFFNDSIRSWNKTNSDNKTPPDKDEHHSKIRMMIIIIATSVLGGFTLIVCVCLFLGKQNQELIDNEETIKDISDAKSLQYDVNAISAATNNFSDANELGQGGFGSVYKGKFPNGQDIAVKRLSKNSGQGDIEFKNEVLLVAKLQHRNLVRLLGFGLEGTERLLIYEYMPNASLDQLMFDPIKSANLDWDRRYKIIVGVAKGLLYLHEDSRLRIIHRDLKASNVLLDEDMNPKISDFGMAKFFAQDENQASTNRIVGTYGYMAPEYAGYGQFSPKSDVYSFGVLVLEIVSGRKNSSFRHGENVENLPSYAWKNWRDGGVENLIDTTLGATSGSMHDIVRCIHVGLLCVQENVNHRPTMSKVLLMLSSSSLTLPEPSEPGFLMHNDQKSDNLRLGEESDSRSKSASVNEASITELHPR